MVSSAEPDTVDEVWLTALMVWLRGDRRRRIKTGRGDGAHRRVAALHAVDIPVHRGVAQADHVGVELLCARRQNARRGRLHGDLIPGSAGDSGALQRNADGASVGVVVDQQIGGIGSRRRRIECDLHRAGGARGQRAAARAIAAVGAERERRGRTHGRERQRRGLIVGDGNGLRRARRVDDLVIEIIAADLGRKGDRNDAVARQAMEIGELVAPLMVSADEKNVDHRGRKRGIDGAGRAGGKTRAAVVGLRERQR